MAACREPTMEVERGGRGSSIGVAFERVLDCLRDPRAVFNGPVFLEVIRTLDGLTHGLTQGNRNRTRVQQYDTPTAVYLYMRVRTSPARRIGTSYVHLLYSAIVLYLVFVVEEHSAGYHKARTSVQHSDGRSTVGITEDVVQQRMV